MKKTRKPQKKIFDFLIGMKISALFDHFQYGGKPIKESYFGTVMGREDGYLIIKPSTSSFVTKKGVELVMLREDQILSFWVYGEEKHENFPY